jgi:hypothetical protein
MSKPLYRRHSTFILSLPRVRDPRPFSNKIDVARRRRASDGSLQHNIFTRSFHALLKTFMSQSNRSHCTKG